LFFIQYKQQQLIAANMMYIHVIGIKDVFEWRYILHMTIKFCCCYIFNFVNIIIYFVIDFIIDH